MVPSVGGEPNHEVVGKTHVLLRSTFRFAIIIVIFIRPIFIAIIPHAELRLSAVIKEVVTSGERSSAHIHQFARFVVDFINDLWKPRALITCGGYDRESGLKVAEETGQIIGYGRAFTANVCP